MNAKPPLLILPGALGRRETAFEYIAAFEETRCVLAPSYPPAKTSMTALTDWLIESMDERAIAEADVYGGSFGGLVAQALAERFPARVRRLALSDTSAPNPRRALRNAAAITLLSTLPVAATRSVFRAGIRSYVAEIEDAEARAFWRAHFAETIDALSRDDFVARARVWSDFDARFSAPAMTAFPGPVLLIDAAGDAFVSRRERAALRRRFPRAEARTVPGGHAASIARADAYIAALREFFA